MPKRSIGESEPAMEFDEVLNSELGQWGRFQTINIILLAVPAVFCGFMAGDYIFTAAKLPHRCWVPECDGPQTQFTQDWLHYAIPKTSSGFEECSRFANITDLTASSLTCSEELFDTNRTIPCESFVFERTNSVVYDFGLECQEWLRALAGTLNSMGAMIALPLGGYISDHFGRRTSIVFFSFNLALIGFIRSFSVNYTMYVVLQFMQTALGGGAFSASYILATEIVGPKYRVKTSATMSSMFALGQVLLGVIASFVGPWRTLSLVLFTPVFLLISYQWILTESFRWLLSKNKVMKAKTVLEKAARMNGKNVSEDNMNFLLTVMPKEANKNIEHANENVILRVIKSPVLLRRCITTPVWWITTTFVYYGLSINSVSLSGNMYMNYIATAAIEIPGFWTAVFVLDKAGRKVTLFMGFLFCACCCIAFAFFTSKNWFTVSLLLYLAGKFSIALVFTSLYLYTSELYPTQYRHSFLGFSSMMGRVGSVISPLTPPLMVYWEGIPSMLFGGMAIISAILVLTQPETLGLKLPDSLEDAEQIGKDK